MNLTSDGRAKSKWFFLEKPKRSRTMLGSALLVGESVMPRTNTGLVGGREFNNPTNVVRTESLKVLYQRSILGK